MAPPWTSSPDFATALHRVGLGRWADALVALDRPSVRLRGHGPADDGDVAVGSSKLGGAPDLAVGAAWPTWKGAPLSFVAQVSLAEMPTVPDQPLPEAGLLSFFWDAEEQACGFDPADRGGAVVVWTDPERPLERQVYPADLPAYARHGCCPLTGELETTHVNYESADLQALGLSIDELDTYGDLLHAAQDPTIHRLLGYPEQIQPGDMQLDSQLASNGVWCGSGPPRDDPRVAELRPGAADWRLLLQVDSERTTDMIWGDLGRFYVWIPQPALATRTWSATWTHVQCS